MMQKQETLGINWEDLIQESPIAIFSMYHQ